MHVEVRFSDLLAIYRAELLERVAPFWLAHAIDWKNGGISTCISDEGVVLSEDKYMWSQLRAIWTFSALYNRIERRPEWLDVARHVFAFVKKHGRDEQGQWVFSVSKEGRPLQGATSIYADGFALYGLTELAKATGDVDAIKLALETYANVQRRLAVPGSYKTDPYTIPEGMKAHGVSMIFSLAFYELGRYLNDPQIINAGLYHANEVMTAYLRPEKNLLYEYVSLDNQLVDSPQGHAVVPGHAIECMWFMLHIYQHEGNQERIRQAIEAIRWHTEFGWDGEYGGIFLGMDAEGQSPWWKFADAKVWWPHTEALYSLLLAYHLSREDWCLHWYERVHDYAWTRYPVPVHGEWTQRLDRRGNRLNETVALPVKDPFHLPRALIYCIEVLSKLSQ